VPKLVALLGDENAEVRAAACAVLTGIEPLPLPALRRALSGPSPDKQQFAQHAIASIETKCFGVPATDAVAEIHEGSPCDAPPYGDTLAAYKAFAQPFVSISLGPPTRMLAWMCNLKLHPLDQYRLGHWSDEYINTHGTIALEEEELAESMKSAALAEKQLAAMVKSTPHEDQTFAAYEDRELAAMVKPADLFLCFQPDGSCQRIPATPSSPISSLFDCEKFAMFLSEYGPTGVSPETWIVRGAGAWYECRSK
jgi:hypothetical protein